ncbi:MAG TPA: hypothetical protein PKY98_03920, partial [Sedimentibacter sp.]|nr:hypothetical protein [Sedimentibacter sp.]
MKYCCKYQIISALSVSFLFAALFNYKLVISLSLTFMLSGFLVSILDKRVKSLPSSIEGFIIEISQLMFLVITYMLRL